MLEKQRTSPGMMGRRWPPSSAYGREGTFSRAFRSLPTPTAGGKPRWHRRSSWPKGRRKPVAAAVRARKCGNGNVRGPRGHVRGPRAGGGDAKRHDELCPPTLGPRSGTKRRSWLVKPPMPLRFRTFEPALQQQPAAKKSPGRRETLGASKNRGYLLSQLVGQYHRRW